MKVLSDVEKRNMIELMIFNRKKLGISREELARRTGLSQQHIRKLERKLDTTYMDDYLLMADIVGLEMLKRDLKENY
ncbi:helix-turn-helix domain-containing protein [Bacillus sp. Marseille-P3800]|uniref:helix-turn-helix domain-containing protein n=1 Tax=Bacillus sp. Marseille-P3800 TaxID=2014782 RepID=UPI000C07629D|nr:helix-turn-helix transcriptional regulator [Bacillus sp. Marseille-P3800]